jgi:hypothetical protein
MFTFQFPNSDAERTSVDAPSSPWPCPPGPYRGLQWGQLKVYVSAIFENRSKEKLYAKVDDLSSNFETATLRERLPMPAVAVAVSFVSVSSSRVGQLKVYMSAIFENQSEETPRQSRVGDIYLPISKQRRSKNFYRCGPSHSRLSIALRCSLCHGSAIGRTVDLGTA